jgi:hypothetical protein
MYRQERDTMLTRAHVAECDALTDRSATAAADADAARAELSSAHKVRMN